MTKKEKEDLLAKAKELNISVIGLSFNKLEMLVKLTEHSLESARVFGSLTVT